MTAQRELELLVCIEQMREAIREAREWNWLDDDSGEIPVTEKIQAAINLQPNADTLKAYVAEQIEKLNGQEPVAIVEDCYNTDGKSSRITEYLPAGTPLYLHSIPQQMEPLVKALEMYANAPDGVRLCSIWARDVLASVKEKK